MIKTIINGHDVEFDPAPDASAIEIIREEAKLTGTKLVCGAGVCGACTILVDGKPTTSCLMPAHSLEGKDVRTIEAHPAEQLHPIQKAFMANDALQCGYCTPGFINEGIAFYDRWRTEHGKTEPSRAQIALAMSGHLCRCAAYNGIYEAIRTACRGDFDKANGFVSPRIEAIAKVTGQAMYTTDIDYEGMLVGRLLGSPHANAKITSIDTSAAGVLPGVKAIVEVLDDQHRMVRYVGQPILAIAAINEDVAHEAIEKVRIQFEVRPFVTGLENALQPDAVIVYPEKKKIAPNASEGPIAPAKWEGNKRIPMINKFLSQRNGKAKRIVNQAANDPNLLLVRQIYKTSGQTHTTLEPHCAVAHWESNGNVTLHASTQTVHLLAKKISHHYKIDRKNVTVYSEFIGGAFGAKQGLTIEMKSALELSRKAKAPVKLVYDRLEEMVLGGYRPITQTELSLVADTQGRQKALVANIYGDCGIAVQSQVAPWMRLTYSGMPKSLADFDVVTNSAPAKPFRGPSGPAAFWALESAVDEMAYKSGLDPISLRRQWDKSDIRGPLYDWAESIPTWNSRGGVNSSSGRFKKGTGLAIGNWFNAYHNASKVELAATAEGLIARSATQDMGNGSRSVIGKAIAEELEISLLEINVEIGNSEYVEGPISGGSKATNSLYSTSIDAARKMRDRLLAAAKSHLGLKNARWKHGGIQHGQGHISLAEILKKIPPVSVVAKRGGNGALDIMGKMPAGELGINMIMKMTGSVYVAEVVVDTWLGTIRVNKFWAGIGAGKIVNPELAVSQIRGGVIQGIGYALYEERQTDPTTGTLLSFGLEDYRIPGIGDTPEIETHFYEGGFEKVKGGACGISELSTLAVAPAIGNAVFHATGWRPTEIPLRPHRVILEV